MKRSSKNRSFLALLGTLFILTGCVSGSGEHAAEADVVSYTQTYVLSSQEDASQPPKRFQEIYSSVSSSGQFISSIETISSRKAEVSSSGVASSSSRSHTSSTAGSKGSSSKPVAETPNSQMVWIPKTGKRYHSNARCSNMKNPTKTTLQEAVSLGYTPCKKCY